MPSSKPIAAKEPPASPDLPVRAAWLYYIEGLTQEEVAKAMAVSRAKGIRLLICARVLKIVVAGGRTAQGRSDPGGIECYRRPRVDHGRDRRRGTSARLSGGRGLESVALDRCSVSRHYVMKTYKRSADPREPVSSRTR